MKMQAHYDYPYVLRGIIIRGIIEHIIFYYGCSICTLSISVVDLQYSSWIIATSPLNIHDGILQ